MKNNLTPAMKYRLSDTICSMRNLALTVCMLLWLGNLHAIPADTLWNQANQRYTEGKFEEASKLYEQILAGGQESADLYFNLGNAYFKQSLTGPARLNYERALRLDPENEDILHNLQFAKAMQLDKIDEVQEMFLSVWFDKLLNTFTSDGWAALFIGLFVLFLVFLLTYLFTNRYGLRKISFLSTTLLLLLLLVSFVFGNRQRSKQIDNSHAIIVAPVVTVKGSPDASGADLFIIHEGLKVKVIGEQGAWRRIVLTDGQSQGWAPKESMVVI